MKCTLIIGGARSGKSTRAQEVAITAGGKVLFVATAEAGDEEMRLRIKAHRRDRPAGWQTLETPTRLGHHISRNIAEADIVIIDCVTLLVSNILMKHGENADAAGVEKEVLAEIGELNESMDKSDAHFIIVTNELGLGIVPADRLSRLYRDLLGRANQKLAGRADEVILMVAGLPLTIKPEKGE